MRLADEAPVRFDREPPTLTPAGTSERLAKPSSQNRLETGKPLLGAIQSCGKVRRQGDRPNREQMLAIAPDPAEILHQLGAMPRQAAGPGRVATVKR